MITNESLELLKMLYFGVSVECTAENAPLLRHLHEEELISYRTAGFNRDESSPSGFTAIYANIRITENGRAYVQQAEAENRSIQEQISVLREMAHTAADRAEADRQKIAIYEERLAAQKQQLTVQKKQLSTQKKRLAMYREQLDDAKKDSHDASVRSWIAIVISLFAIAATIAGSALSAGLLP